MSNNLDDLKQLQVKFQSLGLNTKPPLSEKDVIEFEKDAGIMIPEDYRYFLINVANGGNDPCRLISLDEWDWSYWIGALQPRMISEPCLITPDLYQYGEHWLDHLGVEDWQNRWDKDEWSPMFGTIAIANYGCGLRYSLIMNGHYRGRIFIWGDHYLNPPYVQEESSFSHWLEVHVDNMLQGNPVHFLDGRLK